MLIKRRCDFCNNEYMAQKYDFERLGVGFCSRKCFGLAERGKNNPNWQGGIENRARYSKENRIRYPERAIARDAMRQKIRSGKIVRQPCSVCGEKNAQSHHINYERPFDIVWLCVKHHSEIHQKKADDTKIVYNISTDPIKSRTSPF